MEKISAATSESYRPRIQHRRLFRLRQRGIQIVGIHHLVGEIRLPIAQGEVMFLIEVAGIDSLLRRSESRTFR